MVTNQKQK